MKPAIRISLAYAVLAILWVISSDWLVEVIAPDRFVTSSLYKGTAFVLVTSAAFWLLLDREFRRRDAAEEELRRLAVRDPLTGLLNRTCFMEYLEHAVARAGRDRSTVGVIFIDLDGFKAVNDEYGHQTGDLLLVEAASRLKALLRAGDSIARFGGDEFVILVCGDRIEEGTERLAERLVEAMRLPFRGSHGVLSLTASVGFALLPDHGSEGEQLVRAADIAMYRAKSVGKNMAVAACPLTPCTSGAEVS